ncbi:hypothetical protein V5O48_007237 [Marasmius crinis-equi]|uniref:Uncharacterized protein n=1 Tax=Marasmius crinis-equi TaxID=585013 RepID=A0ABR3FH97_9AGAR
MSGEVKSNSSISDGKHEKDVEVGHELKELDSGYGEVDERKTMRYIDLRILPVLAITYAFSIIDRVNLGSARVAGMGKDLELNVGSRYSIVNCIYFIPLMLLQVPGNVILRFVVVRYWITFIVISWGIVVFGMGFVKHWGLLALCRVFVGALEIIEGAITVALGILVFFVIPDFPDRNTFLTKAQTAFVLKRIEEDRGDSVPDEMTARKVLDHLSDWTLWVYGIMFGCATIPGYMLAFFLPIILGGLNFNTTQSLLLTCPPFAASCVTAMIFAWLSDKTKHRSGFIVIQCLITITGACMTAFAESIAARYTGAFFMCCGCQGCIPGILAWGANNVTSQSKRSVQSALTIAVGGFGGVIASTVFREKDSPKYIPGLWVTIGLQIVCIILTIALSLHFSRMNRLAEEGRLAKPLQGKPGFRYTL